MGLSESLATLNGVHQVVDLIVLLLLEEGVVYGILSCGFLWIFFKNPIKASVCELSGHIIMFNK